MLWCLSLWTRPCFLLKPFFNIVIKLFLSQFLFWLVLRQPPPPHNVLCIRNTQNVTCVRKCITNILNYLCEWLHFLYKWCLDGSWSVMFSDCSILYKLFIDDTCSWPSIVRCDMFLVRPCSTVSFHYNCVAREPSQYIFLKRHVMFCWPQTCLTELSSYLWMYFLQLCHNVEINRQTSTVVRMIDVLNILQIYLPTVIW